MRPAFATKVALVQLKTLGKEAIPHALERVERYRLLNEPAVAESICQDILQVDPDHQQALVMLILVTTDQFAHNPALGNNTALALVQRLGAEHDRAYYTGIVYERQAKARLVRQYPGAGFDAYEMLLEAMGWFEKALGLESAESQDAVMRYNNCVRVIEAHDLTARPREQIEPSLE